MKEMGWLMSTDMSPRPASLFNVIGASLDLGPLPRNMAYISITKKRIRVLITTITNILKRGTLGSGEAASLAGKLGFSLAAVFGRTGRARVRPILRRAYSYIKVITPDIRITLGWWLKFLQEYVPRPIPHSLKELPCIVSYSDGEGGDAGVGVALWAPWLDKPLAAYCEVPKRIRELWAQAAGKENYRDISLIEAVGPLILLTTFPRVMCNCLWLNFIDNAGAEASLLKGSSAIGTGGHVVGLTWTLIERNRLWPYFDRVSSKSNPVDGLSRGEFNAP